MTTLSKRQADARDRARVALLAITERTRNGVLVMPEEIEAVVDNLIEAATPDPSEYAAGVSDLLSQLQPGERDPRD